MNVPYDELRDDTKALLDLAEKNVRQAEENLDRAVKAAGAAGWRWDGWVSEWVWEQPTREAFVRAVEEFAS